MAFSQENDTILITLEGSGNPTVYVPLASNTIKGIASFNSADFIIAGGHVILSESRINSIITTRVVQTEGASTNNIMSQYAVTNSLTKDRAEYRALGTNQPDNTTANLVGTANVQILNPGTADARFKFNNLKGQQGIQGIQGIQGVGIYFYEYYTNGSSNTIVVDNDVWNNWVSGTKVLSLDGYLHVANKSWQTLRVVIDASTVRLRGHSIYFYQLYTEGKNATDLPLSQLSSTISPQIGDTIISLDNYIHPIVAVNTSVGTFNISLSISNIKGDTGKDGTSIIIVSAGAGYKSWYDPARPPADLTGRRILPAFNTTNEGEGYLVVDPTIVGADDLYMHNKGGTTWDIVYDWGGVQGEKGEKGVGIANVVTEYAVSTDGVNIPTNWTTVIAIPGQGQWLWIRTIMVLTDGGRYIIYGKNYQGKDGLMTDAPSDGKQYVRQNAGWAIIGSVEPYVVNIHASDWTVINTIEGFPTEYSYYLISAATHGKNVISSITTYRENDLLTGYIPIVFNTEINSSGDIMFVCLTNIIPINTKIVVG